MYATTFLLTGITLLQPGEGPYMDPENWTKNRGGSKHNEIRTKKLHTRV